MRAPSTTFVYGVPWRSETKFYNDNILIDWCISRTCPNTKRVYINDKIGEQMNCPICNSSDLIDVVYHQGVYRCEFCSHLFRHPQTSYNFYEEHDYWYDDPMWFNFQKTYFTFFKKYITYNSNALEVGAANGDFLVLVQQYLGNMGLHPKLYYNELKDIIPNHNDVFIPTVNRLIGPIEEMPGIKDPPYLQFGNIFMIEVLEHFKDPMLCIELLCNRLSKNGRIHIATDNGNHLYAADMMFRHQEHLHIFTEKSFDILIQKLKLPLKKKFWWNSPAGKSYTVLEKTCV